MKTDKEGGAPPDVSKASIEGVVVDEDGKPVAGAVVGVIAPDPSLVTSRTAADGAFRLVLNETAVRNEVVLASAEDGERQGIHEFAEYSAPLTAQARIILKPSRKMTVHVTDAAKKPVRDAVVGVLDNWKLLAHAETDADGTVSLRFPSTVPVTDVVVLKPQTGLDYFENFNAALPSKVVEPPTEVALKLDGRELFPSAPSIRRTSRCPASSWPRGTCRSRASSTPCSFQRGSSTPPREPAPAAWPRSSGSRPT